MFVPVGNICSNFVSHTPTWMEKSLCWWCVSAMGISHMMCCLEHIGVLWEFPNLHVRVHYCSQLPHRMSHGPVCICVNVGSSGLGLWHGINRKRRAAISGYNEKRWCIACVAGMFNTIVTKNRKCQQAQFLFYIFNILRLKKNKNCPRSWSAIVWHFWSRSGFCQGAQLWRAGSSRITIHYLLVISTPLEGISRVLHKVIGSSFLNGLYL